MKFIGNLKRKSIFVRIFSAMLCLIIIETTVFFGVLFFGGLFNTLNQHQFDLLNEKTKSRKDILQSEMIRWSNLEDSVSILNDNTADVLSDYSGADLDNLDARFDAYGGNYTLAEIILRKQSDSLVEILRYSQVNGWMIVLNDGTLGANAKNGLYLRSNTESSSSSTSLMQKISPPMVRGYLSSQNISTSSNYKNTFMLDSGKNDTAFFDKPFNLALSQTNLPDTISTRSYGYWSHPFVINDSGDALISYTVPLVYKSKVYGVAGIEIQLENIQGRLTFAELNDAGNGVYYLGIGDGESNNFIKALSSGPAFTKLYGDKKQLTAAQDKKYDYAYVLDKSDRENKDIYGCVQGLKLYNDNSPFAEDEWTLIGFIEKDILFSFTNNLRFTVVISVVAVFIVGLGVAILTSYALSHPISKLTKKVKSSNATERIKLSKVNIYEIDQFIEEIDRLNASISEYESGEKSKIMHERDHDGLTHLKNRRAFGNFLQEIAQTPQKIKTAALVMLDIDNLKFVNDTYGHDAGDSYIKKAASVLQKFESEHLVAARMAGDEFYMLIYGFDTQEPITKIINQLEANINSSSITLPQGTVLDIRFSGGISWYEQDSTDFETLIKYADFAMYMAKRHEKGKFVQFNKDVYARETSLLKSREDFNKLVDGQHVEYYFQPIACARTGEVVGYEALMRSTLPELKNLGEIMSLAQTDAKLYKLEELTWLKALENFKHESPKADKFLYINTFANQTITNEIVEKLEKDYPEYLQNIIMALTESEKDNPEYTALKRSLAQRWGAKLALDGFGSGYNGNAMLLSVRPEQVVINRDLIHNIDKDADRLQLLKTFLTFTSERGISVIAAGIETVGELRTVIESGVEYLQGNMLCEPKKGLSDLPQDLKTIIKKLNPQTK